LNPSEYYTTINAISDGKSLRCFGLQREFVVSAWPLTAGVPKLAYSKQLPCSMQVCHTSRKGVIKQWWCNHSAPSAKHHMKFRAQV